MFYERVMFFVVFFFCLCVFCLLVIFCFVKDFLSFYVRGTSFQICVGNLPVYI